MAAAATGTRRAYSVGNLMLYVQPLTKVMDASTHASGLDAGSIRGYWVNATGEASVSVKAGCDVSNSGGTFTLHNPDATYGKNMDLYIFSTELE